MSNSATKRIQRLLAIFFSVFMCFAISLLPVKASAQTSNRDTIFNFIVNKIGLTPAAACGILTNIYFESGYDPTAGNANSMGLCQWTGQRFTNLKNFCANNGYDYRSVTGQLYFLKYEFENSEWNAYNKMKAIKNSADEAYKAAYDFCRYFERGGNTTTWQSRGEYSKNTLWPIYGSDGTGTDTPSDPVVLVNPDSYPVPTRTLVYVKGSVMTGDDVCWVQAVLFRLGYEIDIDGSFGPASMSTVLQFQKDQGLKEDGKVNTETREKLIFLWNSMKKSKGDVDENGTIDEKDSVALGRYLAGWNVKISASNADLNNDNDINENDAVMLGRILAGWKIF